jgi:transcriptional regulator with XRE-family HTH domain
VAGNKKHHRVLGATIRSYREEAGLSQEKLAEKANLHHNYVGEVERGEKAVSIDTMLKIAAALDLRVSDLVKDL